MKKSFVLSTVTAAVALLAGASAAKAVSTEFSLPAVQPSVVTPGDTFSFDLLGYNTASGSGYFIGEGDPTFGTTTTFTGYDGNVITVTSSEAVGATTTVDTFSFTTPTSFLTDTTINGVTITGIELDLGNANSGAANGLAAGDTVDLLTSTASATGKGTTTYNTTTKANLSPGTTLSNGNSSYAAVEGIQAGTAAINQYTVHSFTYTITYSNLPLIPEPSSFALGALGLAACAGVVLRRRRVKV